ncbi:MAG: SDR family NAD(P)-dependent oxidoreductase [Ignavibacteria bacterium]|nr:SDR family NAD(P)-dependent oxidoreductase [Ignavibacteria bacterium]
MKNRIAIVTGGTGALGRRDNSQTCEKGLRFMYLLQSLDEFNSVFDNSHKDDSDAFRLRKIYSFVCNATDENSVKEFVKNVYVQEKGSIDFLINTVGGISPVSEVPEIKTDDLDRMINLNFKTAFYFSREVLKIMKAEKLRKDNFCRRNGRTEATPGRFSYSFSKAGVISLMDTISEENKEFNIRCNTIIPSVIDTPANREWGSAEEIKKWVKPGDIANIDARLLSDEFSSVSNIIKVYALYK